VDNQDEALRVTKSLNCTDLILDVRTTPPLEAQKQVNAITAPINKGRGGCAATIVLPESQEAFDYAMKITRKHGTVMIISAVITFTCFLDTYYSLSADGMSTLLNCSSKIFTSWVRPLIVHAER
jgi:hypothetical protein